MNAPVRQLEATPAAPDVALPPELVRIIEALAEAQARKDFAAQYPPTDAT